MSSVPVPRPPNPPEGITREIKEGQVDTLDTNVRYLAYVNRLRTVALSSSRYFAYTSDVGESFRRVTSPIVVRSAYAISWGYVLTDVSYEAYKAKSLRNEPGPVVASIAAKRAVFQSIASMGLPALTIHSLVKYSSRFIFSHSSSKALRNWGPAGVGLGIVPSLPYLFDHPVEQFVDGLWERVDRFVLPVQYQSHLQGLGSGGDGLGKVGKVDEKVLKQSVETEKDRKKRE